MNRPPFFAICLIVAAAAVVAATPAGTAYAHPTITNGMEVVVHSDRVEIRARIALEEIDIAHRIDETGVGAIDPAKLKQALAAHGPYLLAHLRVTADEVPVAGKLVDVTPPVGEVTWARLEQLEAFYALDYPLPTPRPAKVRIEHDLLKEFSRLGQPWMVLFIAQARQAHETEPWQTLIARDEPLDIVCSWDDATAAATTTTTQAATAPAETRHPPIAATSAPPTRKIAAQFAVQGFEHILTGYDHLLFVAALVLAATQLWDLVKVVTAFAVAHTLTLTLSVLHLLRLPSSIVEPIIAASIVVVALQNVIFPRQSRGAARLAVAFVFGLFHGLGFAGGLLEAMDGMPAINLAVALLAFTLGVEAAHQVLIVPLYFLLRPLRRSAADAGAAAAPPVALPLRLASLAISLAGAFYLVQALR